MCIRDSYYAYVNDSKVDTLKMESEALSKSFTKLKYRYICDLGWHDEGDVISLHSEDSTSLNVSAYRLNETVMAGAIDILSQESMTVDSFDSTHIKGHIDVSRPGELILSVPYEPGWKILVDGEKVQAGLFDDTFISLSLEPVSYTHLRHTGPGNWIPHPHSRNRSYCPRCAACSASRKEKEHTDDTYRNA